MFIATNRQKFTEGCYILDLPIFRLRREVNESKALLESERKLRLKLEEQIHALEAQLQLQIDVPEVDNSEEITAHILGRKPAASQKMFKVEYDKSF